MHAATHPSRLPPSARVGVVSRCCCLMDLARIPRRWLLLENDLSNRRASTPRSRRGSQMSLWKMQEKGQEIEAEGKDDPGGALL